MARESQTPVPQANPSPAAERALALRQREQALSSELRAAEAEQRQRAGGGPWHAAWKRLGTQTGARASLWFLAFLGLLSLLAPLWPLPSPVAMQLRAEPRPPVWPWSSAEAQAGDVALPLGQAPTQHLRGWANDGWSQRALLNFRIAEPCGSEPPAAAAALIEFCEQLSGQRPNFSFAAQGQQTRLCLALPLLERDWEGVSGSVALDAAGWGPANSATTGEQSPGNQPNSEQPTAQMPATQLPPRLPPNGLAARFAAANQPDGALTTLCNSLPGQPRLESLELLRSTWALGPLDRWLLDQRARIFGLWQSGPWLGTDSKGRDLLARLVWGSRISLQVSLVAALCSLLIGVTYGATAGYLGGRIDNAMMRIVDALYSLPLIFLVIFLVSILNAYRGELAAVGIDRLTLFYGVLGAVSWLTMARVVRGQVLRLRQLDFVLALEALGASRLRIIVRHLLPNLLSILIVYLTLTIPSVLLYEAFLSFLGLGVEPPQVSWGLLAQDGSEALSRLHVFWWLLVFPAAFMGLTLLALNLLGDALREVLDPKTAQRGNP